MGGVFDVKQDETAPVAHRRDREFTLGPMLLLGSFFGLVLLCGLCFGVGYSVGSRNAAGAAPSIAQPAAAVPPSATDAQAKPAAAAIGVLQSQIDGNAAGLAAVNSLLPGATVGNASPAVPLDANSSQPNPAQANPNQASPNQAGANQAGAAQANPAQVKPALFAAQAPLSGQQANAVLLPAFTVQIATVVRQDDAAALVSTLRAHGYAVTVRRDPPNGAFHVGVGPFNSRQQAVAMRRRLLGDGFNAVVQPQ